VANPTLGKNFNIGRDVFGNRENYYVFCILLMDNSDFMEYFGFGCKV